MRPMAASLALLLALISALGARATDAAAPVLVAGATGRTGSFIYKQLRNKSVAVRALVRNATKARELLGCSKCDESEGIFVGDLTEPATLSAPVRGAASLVIATSAPVICDPYPHCHFPKGSFPIDVDWNGAKNLLESFARAAGVKAPVALISTMGTTEPEPANDTFQHMSFYKLNFEAELMASGLPFTIVKPCGLDDKPPAAMELVVGHDDMMNLSLPMIARADVARVVVASLEVPTLAAGLRFDLCSRDSSTPTTDSELPNVLRAAKYPWEKAKLPELSV